MTMVNEHCRRALNSVASPAPIIVNCSAGKGRTGTFIASYFIYEQLMDWSEKQGEQSSKEGISIFRIVRRIREQRWGLVSKQVKLKEFWSLELGVFEEQAQYESLYSYCMRLAGEFKIIEFLSLSPPLMLSLQVH